MDSTNIHWGLGAHTLDCVEGSSDFSYWNLACTSRCTPIYRKHSGKVCPPQRYQLSHWVGHHSSRMSREKRLDEKFLRYGMSNVLKSQWSEPKI